MRFNRNLAVQTDSYKVSHWLQFPPNTEKAYYYVESRGGAYELNGVDELRFAILQPILDKMLSKMPTVDDINKADMFWTAHGEPFNKQGWLDLVELGYFPLEIKAVEEGKICKAHEPLITVVNTDERFAWLPGWIETRLLQIWYPITVASKLWGCKKVILDFLESTGTPEDIMFKLHSFGYRGVSSDESAELGGMAELVNFMGTDTSAGLLGVMEYYGTDGYVSEDEADYLERTGMTVEDNIKAEMAGFSIPAAEHSTMTSWGQENEVDAYRNMLDQFAKPGALVAVVSDSYDLENAVEKYWGGELKQQVLDSGATVVIRPDSGEPKEIVLRTLKQLDRLFGSIKNDKGYKVLNPAVRVIQGDGISSRDDLYEILDNMKDAGYSADNVAFGMGGGSLQQVNRDTLKFAMKCSAIKQNGVWKDVYKNPVDAPWKASKGGRFDDNLQVVWKDGDFVKRYTFDEVRNNA